MSFICSAATNGLIERLFELDRNSDPNRLTEMRSILETNPRILNVRHFSYNRHTLLHYTILERGSVDFIKLIIELNPELVRTTTTFGVLPIHTACRRNPTVDIIRLLLELYPESINLQQYPIHTYLERSGDPNLEVLQILLNHDQGAVRTPDEYGNLPLHKVIGMCDTSVVDAVRLVFDAYPQAVYVQNNLGKTPLDFAEEFGYSNDYVYFDELSFQLLFVVQARQVRIPHRMGQLPLHSAVQNDNVSLGTVKLMVEANPDSIRHADRRGMIPLHIACQVGNIEIVKFLMKANEESQNMRDNDFALHHACIGGRCDIVNSVLSQTTRGASQNMDGKLPIEYLLYDAECDRESHDYIEAVYHLLCVYPDSMVELMESSSSDESSGDEGDESSLMDWENDSSNGYSSNGYSSNGS